MAPAGAFEASPPVGGRATFAGDVAPSAALATRLDDDVGRLTLLNLVGVGDAVSSQVTLFPATETDGILRLRRAFGSLVSFQPAEVADEVFFHAFLRLVTDFFASEAEAAGMRAGGEMGWGG